MKQLPSSLSLHTWHLRQSSCRVESPTLSTILSLMVCPHSLHSAILLSLTVIKDGDIYFFARCFYIFSDVFCYRLTSALLAPCLVTELLSLSRPGPAPAAAATDTDTDQWELRGWRQHERVATLQWRYSLLISLNILLAPAISGMGVCFSVIDYLAKIIHPGRVPPNAVAIHSKIHSPGRTRLSYFQLYMKLLRPWYKTLTNIIINK